MGIQSDDPRMLPVMSTLQDIRRYSFQTNHDDTKTKELSRQESVPATIDDIDDMQLDLNLFKQ